MLDKFGLIIISLICVNYAAEIPECSRPPPFVNPHLCCKDPTPTGVAEICSKKIGFPLTDKEPAMEQTDLGTATCFAECVLKESKYLNGGRLDMPVVEKDIQDTFANDVDYIPVMIAAFKTCEPIAQRKLVTIQATPFASAATKGCSPLSGLILGCVYKEFFENCPASKWTSNAQCNAVQDYMKNCPRS